MSEIQTHSFRVRSEYWAYILSRPFFLLSSRPLKSVQRRDKGEGAGGLTLATWSNFSNGEKVSFLDVPSDHRVDSQFKSHK